jgi:replicative DNA helicase
MSRTLQPNHNMEAEMALLGSMMLTGKVCRRMARDVREDDFFRPGHQHIFAALQKISDEGVEPDLVILRNQLTEAGHIENVGGMDYLIQIAECVPSSANAEHYAKIVREKRVQRDMLDHANQLAGGALQTEIESNDDRFSHWARSFEAVRASHSRSSKIPPSIREIFAEIDTVMVDILGGMKPEASEATSGFLSLDKLIGGFFPGHQVVVGGYSGDGKTAFAFESIIQSVLANGAPWLIISCEMDKEDILRRFIQSRTGIQVICQQKGFVKEDQYQEICDVMEKYRKLPIYIVDRRTTLDQIYIMALKIQSQHGRLGGIAVDYLQLFKNQQPSSWRTWNDAEDLNAIVDRLKEMAKELRCSTLVLSQFNRDSQKDDRSPKLTDLKGSGGIENSADLVLLLHRPNKGEEGTGSELAHVYVAKARFARPGKVTLRFTPSKALWGEA